MAKTSFYFPKTHTLESENYVLRARQKSELEHIFSATRYPGFNDGMPWDPPATREELQPPFQRNEAAWEAGTAFGFSIIRKEDQVFCGHISIRPGSEAGAWNVGFWTHPREQKKGVMSEALGTMLDFGFQQLEAERIEAAYAIWNKASERVLHKNGFRFVKFIEKAFLKKGDWVDENFVVVEKNTWIKQAK